MDHHGKVAIVTGSATGIGAASAIRLAGDGYNTVINYTKSLDQAEQTAAACRATGVEAIVVQADVASDEACQAMVQAAVDAWGRVDALVNNAGTTTFVEHSNLDGIDADDFLRLTSVNVVGPFQMVRAAAPHMRKVGAGAVVNVSSIAGVVGAGSSIPYCASKGALNTMTLALARALGPEIRVNAVCPGMVQTRWLKQGLGADNYQALYERQTKNSPLRRVATAEDIADAVHWFITGAALVTGEIQIVDAGMHLGFAPLKAR